MSTVPEPETSNDPSFWHRVRYTHISELLRGRLTGDLDYQHIIAQSGLPENVRQLIWQTVEQARLWSAEKVDITNELVAHFHDGITQGVDQIELLELFGDPTLTGKLISRAKKRNRSFSWKLMVWMRNTTAALLCVYLLLIAYYWSLSPTISVDYIAKFNDEARQIPQAKRAWPVYQQAAALIGKERYKELEKLYYDEVTEAKRLEQAAKYISEFPDEVIPLIQQAATKPHLGVIAAPYSTREMMLFPEDWSEDYHEHLKEQQNRTHMAIEILLPHVQEIRHFARILTLDIQLAQKQHATDRLFNDLTALYNMTKQVGQGKTLIEQLVGLSIVLMAENELHNVLRESPELLSDVQLIQLAHQLSLLDSLFDVDPTYERHMFYDAIQHIYSDDGNGNGVLTTKGLQTLSEMRESYTALGVQENKPALSVLLPAMNMIAYDRRQIVTMYNDLMMQAEIILHKPFWKVSENEYPFESWHNSLKDWEKPRLLPLLTFHISTSGMHTAVERRRATRDATLLVIAAELFRREHHHWPETMQELIPRYLPSTVFDRYTGDPMRYQVREDQLLLYSVGPDLNDDGGKLVKAAINPEATPQQRVESSNAKTWLQRWPAEHKVDGDWILWWSKDWKFE